MSDLDKKYMGFGRAFESQFISQEFGEERDIMETLDLGWLLLSLLPREELDRLSPELVDKYYTDPEESESRFRRWM